MDQSPTLFPGIKYFDDRGFLSFCNELDLTPIKRQYFVSNFSNGFKRAWHGHKKESKLVSVIRGAALIACVRIDNWENPSPELKIHKYVLSGEKPQWLSIPAGYANGFMTLLPETELQFLSDKSVLESEGDDFRFPVNYWNPWVIEER